MAEVLACSVDSDTQRCRVCFNKGNLKNFISFLGPETQQERLKTMQKIFMGDLQVSYGMLTKYGSVLMQQSLA
ncbi:hypothetical protein SLEP1_g25639 [Rubroshorea leprosula]|uniref:Uncharacterized protein n=1 Tax=Rubroshorea leprosula TaxID=152421 RepID=A0AAV5JRS7_9ROSI|nr:hypothetical protein SLEP1_g25639 [Rubroshorea leprosula]